MIFRRCVILGMVALGLAAGAQASGGYSGGFKPAAAVDKQRYEIGRQVFNGTITLATNVDAGLQSSQRPRLQQWQARLPEAQRSKVDLPALAGRLTPAQTDALAHYLNVRFKLDTDAS